MLDTTQTARLITLITMIFLCTTTTVLAILPGTDVLVPAAIRGPGAAGSLWATSLYITNLESDSVQVTLYWLTRDQANPSSALSATAKIDPNGTLAVEDAIGTLFQLETGEGALRIVSTRNVLVSAAILNRAGGAEYGQSFEGIPVSAAIQVGAPAMVPGVIHSASYRSNVFLIDATGIGSRLTVEVLDQVGSSVASRYYTLGAWEPRLISLDKFGNLDLATATLRITVHEGAAISGASRVNRSSGDPVTLGASWQVPAIQGWAAPSLVGKSFIFSLYDPQDGLTESDVVFVTSSAGTVTTSEQGEMALTYSNYATLGNLATMTYSVLDLEVVDMQLVMAWDSATTGFFTGSSDSPDGAQFVAGTFVETVEADTP